MMVKNKSMLGQGIEIHISTRIEEGKQAKAFEIAGKRLGHENDC